MFSFIKWFGNLFQRLQRNKGLWFTFLTTISLAGIFASLYFVNFLVSDVAKKTYENQTKHYVKHIKNQLALQKEMVLATASAIARDGYVITLFESHDQNKSRKLKQYASILGQSINTNTATTDYLIRFTQKHGIIGAQKAISGLNVDTDALYFMANIPIVDSNGTVLYVNVNKNAKSIVDTYARESLDAAYLLNDASINKITLQNKKKLFQKFHENYFINPQLFNSSFVARLRSIDLKMLLKKGYAKDSAYFYVVKKLYGYNGDEIGLIIIGEHISEKNSFVNLVKNLVNSVTIVALGLIVSMILFLF